MLNLNNIRTILGLVVFQICIFWVFHTYIIPRIPDDIKQKLTNDITYRISFFSVVIGFITMNLAFVASVLSISYLLLMRSTLKHPHEVVNSPEENSLPIGSNSVDEQKKAAENNVSIKIEKQRHEDKPNEMSYHVDSALNDNLYVKDEQLESQNKAYVRKDELKDRYALHLNQPNKMRHNDVSYQQSNNMFVTGELLENFATTGMKSEFTSCNQFKDAQTNLVNCENNKKDREILCISGKGLQSARKQYSAQGTSVNSTNPPGFNL
jgi:hypothetical protein